MTTASKTSENILQVASQNRRSPGEGHRREIPLQHYPGYYFHFKVGLQDETGVYYPFSADAIPLSAGKRYTVTIEISPLNQSELQAVCLDGEIFEFSLTRFC